MTKCGAIYCAGTLVDGVAGTLVEGVAGVAVVVSDFWQPVSIPTQTRPNTAANVNNFFMRVELLKNLRRRQAKFSGFGNASGFRRQRARLPDQIQIFGQISKTKIRQTALLAA
ncbi:MAG: hypothetical protein ACREDS_14335, partial [Limisphaerales bacterium]